MRSYKDIPWLNQNIKSKIREQKGYSYNLVKASQSPNDWHLYRKAKNNVTSLLKLAHHNYIVLICLMILTQIICHKHF